MSEIKVIYWSQSGNTMSMANAVAEGIKEAGKEAAVLEVSAVTAADLNDDMVFALGCPAMGAEELEETEMEPFVAELEGSVSGKKIGLFGSYGWGDGEWMRDWAERMKNAGAVLLREEGIITNDAPEDDMLEELKAAGQELAQKA
jgi:flavodoxin I